MTVERNRAVRDVRVLEKHKEWLLTRCYSYNKGFCAADELSPCKLQCYDWDMEFENERTPHEKMVKKNASV